MPANPNELGGSLQNPDVIDINLSLMGNEGIQAIQALSKDLQAVHKQLLAVRSPSAASAAAGQQNLSNMMTANLAPPGVSPTASQNINEAQAPQSPGGVILPPGVEPPGSPKEGDSASRPTTEMEAQGDIQKVRGMQRLKYITTGEGKDIYGKHVRDMSSAPVEGTSSSTPPKQAGPVAGGFDRWLGSGKNPKQDSEGLDDESTGEGHLDSLRAGGGPSRPNGGQGDQGPNGARYTGLGADMGFSGVSRKEVEAGMIAPRFGEYSGQDMLQTASNWMVGGGVKAREKWMADPSNVDDQGAPLDPTNQAGAWRIRGGAGLNRAANNFGQIQLAHQTAKRWFGDDEPGGKLGFSIKPSDIQRSGEQLYGREQGAAGGNVSVGGVGFQVPGLDLGGEWGTGIMGTGVGLTKSAEEGIQQRGRQVKQAFNPSISKVQAAEARTAVSQGGYQGTQAMAIQDRVMTPLMQQGQDAEGTMPLIHDKMKYGQATPEALDEVRKTLDNLGDTATKTNIPLDDLKARLIEVGDQMGEFGAGDQTKGTAQARAFAGATGLQPEFLPKALQSPMVQGVGMAKFGAMPGQLGTLPGGSQVGMVGEAVDQAMRSTQGFAKNVPSVKTAHGTFKGDPKEAQIAMAAQRLGMDPREVRPWTDPKRRGEMMAGGEAMTEVSLFEQSVGRAKDRGRGRIDPGAAQALERKAGKGSIGWEELSHTMKKAAIDPKEIEKIKKVPLEKRGEAARRLIEKKNAPPPPPPVLIQFKGLASKMLERVASGGSPGRAGVNAGREAANKVFGEEGPGINPLKLFQIPDVNPF